MGRREHRDRIEELTRPGARIGRYLVIHPLGTGGMGVVVAAYDPQLDRRVAIKLLHRNRPRSRTRLQREAQAMARVSHPNVVAVFDVGTVDEQVFIAMEFVEGQTLHEWNRKGPRDWREVLSVFIPAGRGLQAAHEAGLVHRDFKLENVLLSGDGQAKVTDFGLVRADAGLSESRSRDERSRAEEDPDPEDEDEDEKVYSSDILSTPITRIGALVGTPAFMAPEQFMGLPADTRSDQFSFCVALHMGLWGIPPFPGATVEELRARILGGQQAPRPRERQVPAWVTAIVDRGLSFEAQERWPSMAELLDALEADPSQRRRRRLALGGALALVGSLVAGFGAQEYAGAARCVTLASQVHTHWGQAQREATRSAMLATGTSYAQDSWSRTNAGLEHWLEAWEHERVDSCEAERDRERDAPARSRCLDHQLVELSSLVEVLRHSQRASLAHAVEGVAALPQPERCTDPSWLARFAEVGEDERDERSLELGQELSKARALAQAGREGEAASLARALLERSQRERVSEARAVEARLVLGQAIRGAARDVAELDEALELLERTYYDAQALDLDRLLFETALSLVRASVDRSRFELAERWSRHAEALARRLGERPEDLAQVELARGLLARSRGELEQAEEALRAALELREGLHEAGHPAIAAVRFELGHTLILRRHYDPAREVLEHARSSWVASLGPEHPRVSELETRLAEAARSQGDYPKVIAELERILAQQERTIGREHRSVASTLGTLSVTHAMSGDKQRALPLQREALEIYQRVLGPEHPVLAGVYANLGIMLKGLGRVEEAVTAFERSATLTFAIYGEDSPASGKAHARLGTAYYERQQYERALESTERALALMRTKSGEFDGKAAFTLGLRGTLECKLERPSQGIRSLTQALALVEAQRKSNHPQISEFLVEIGECQAAGDEPARALASWGRALTILKENFGSEDRRVLQLLVDMGELELERGRSAEALTLALEAERGQAGRDQAPALHSSIEWLLARALWERGSSEDRTRARTLANEARERLALPDPAGPLPESETLRSARETTREAIDTWLASP